MATTENIITFASKYIGLKEIKSNALWDDPKTPGKDLIAEEFKQGIELMGHQAGNAYCMVAAKYWFYQGHLLSQAPSNILEIISSNLNPSVMSSYNILTKKSFIKRIPVPGAIFFLQSGDSYHGHAGIVTNVSNLDFNTIEANTSTEVKSSKKDREGEGIFAKRRNLSFTKSKGLHLMGFLHPFQF